MTSSLDISKQNEFGNIPICSKISLKLEVLNILMAMFIFLSTLHKQHKYVTKWTESFKYVLGT